MEGDRGVSTDYDGGVEFDEEVLWYLPSITKSLPVDAEVGADRLWRPCGLLSTALTF